MINGGKRGLAVTISDIDY